MRKFKDDRNRAFNDVFPAIGIGDINISVMYPGTIKAWHRHQHQDDYWFVVKGNIRAGVVGDDTPLQLHYLSEGDLLHIPAGLWHGLQVLGNEDAIMIYHITNKYNPDLPDEERARWDEFFDWEISRK